MDDDCDGLVDEDVTTTVYRDADGDGFGDTADTVDAVSYTHLTLPTNREV